MLRHTGIKSWLVLHLESCSRLAFISEATDFFFLQQIILSIVVLLIFLCITLRLLKCLSYIFKIVLGRVCGRVHTCDMNVSPVVHVSNLYSALAPPVWHTERRDLSTSQWIASTRGRFANSEAFVAVTVSTWLLVGSKGESPEMSLNILPWTQQPET